MAHITVSGIGSGADLGIAGMLTAQCGPPLHTHIHAVDQLNTIATAGINTAFDEVPLQQMFGYTTVLRSMTQGRATSSMEPAEYRIMPDSLKDEVLADA